MWREFLSSFSVKIEFSEPASDQRLAGLETALGIRLPDELRSLLREINGAKFAMQMPGESDANWYTLLWSVEEMQKENQVYREITANSGVSFAPLNSLVFFSSLPNGDPVALPCGGDDTDSLPVVSMSDEDYHERRERFSSLRDFFTFLLETAASYR